MKRLTSFFSFGMILTIWVLVVANQTNPQKDMGLNNISIHRLQNLESLENTLQRMSIDLLYNQLNLDTINHSIRVVDTIILESFARIDVHLITNNNSIGTIEEVIYIFALHDGGDVYHIFREPSLEFHQFANQIPPELLSPERLQFWQSLIEEERITQDLNLEGNNYKLPFTGGTRYTVNQDFNKHFDFGGNGWLVRASRGGIALNGIDQNGAYYTRITHLDGSYGWYLHFQANSWYTGGNGTTYNVYQGACLALTGSTGKTYGPHLHFNVSTTSNNDPGCDIRTGCNPSYWVTVNFIEGIIPTGGELTPYSQNSTEQCTTGGGPLDDYNGDGKPDFYAIDREGLGTNSTEVHILSGADNYQTWLLHSGTPLHQTGYTGEWAFALADYNNDGKPDLYAIDKEGTGTNSTEIHILSGADAYQTWLLRTGTSQHQTGQTGEWVFGLADYDNDSKPDLYLIDKEGTGTNSTEVHILSGDDNYQTWLLHSGTSLHQTGQTSEWAFALADYNSDGKPDLYAIDREGIGTNSTEVHILSGADNFQTWLLHTGTPQHRTGVNNEWAFGLTDYNSDGKPDLYIIDKEGVGTSSTEIHILSGADNYQTWLLHTGTPQHQTGTTCQWDFATGGDCVANVGTLLYKIYLPAITQP